MDTWKLLAAIRGPVDTLFEHFENMSHTAACRTLLEMDVFDKLPLDGSSITATDLAGSLGVDKPLLIRLMRMATVKGPIAEVGPESYAHTPYSQMYIVPALRGLVKLMLDEYWPPMARMCEFLKEDGWKNPESETHNPYTFAHQTGGKSMWEHIDQYPDRAQTFNFAMQSQTQAAMPTVAIFPFEAELGKFETQDDTPLVVDVGGGKGHTTFRIKELCGPIKGRVILQDRSAVIDDISEPLLGVEKMKYDFFTPQPVKGALIYYIRRCLHDWSDEDCVRILKVVADAMEPGKSRLLIAEMCLPEEKADIEAVWYDMTMMTLNGRERTKGDWTKILDDAGFNLKKVYTATGSNYGVVEAYLK
ncbi:O-methyltransferase [Mytilinidion resinicola]|uniref:O-methyltransferase n=1 Tax=Mytilinidion resinicola TaxID=574789 RepID=A0A6A6Y3V9_9PEZI|nr:O-methyltransferase [Mytilinidion resinicola]KAF2802467.1 O-methyltransferase [Mytilinidion resinicola]